MAYLQIGLRAKSYLTTATHADYPIVINEHEVPDDFWAVATETNIQARDGDNALDILTEVAYLDTTNKKMRIHVRAPLISKTTTQRIYLHYGVAQTNIGQVFHDYSYVLDLKVADASGIVNYGTDTTGTISVLGTHTFSETEGMNAANTGSGTRIDVIPSATFTKRYIIAGIKNLGGNYDNDGMFEFMGGSTRVAACWLDSKDYGRIRSKLSAGNSIAGSFAINANKHFGFIWESNSKLAMISNKTYYAANSYSDPGVVDTIRIGYSYGYTSNMWIKEVRMRDGGYPGYNICYLDADSLEDPNNMYYIFESSRVTKAKVRVLAHDYDSPNVRVTKVKVRALAEFYEPEFNAEFRRRMTFAQIIN